jgi:uncharacterized damage-inducible protein DinB
MNTMSNTIADGFIYNYRDFMQRVHSLAEPLSEEQFWTKPYSYGNSFGNLVLHLTGNLNYYIGTQIANTGYVRERDLEFTSTYPGQKQETLQKLDEAVELVIATLKSQSDDDWKKEYSAIGADGMKDRFTIALRCVTHFHHHVGQMIYLAKEFQKAGGSGQ